MSRITPKTFYFNKSEKAVILLHSYTGTPNDMRLLARKLEDQDYSVYAPLFAGHGTQDPENIITKGHPSIWWQQTIDAIEFLKKENKSEIAIFGLSLGSIFATKALEVFNNEISCGGVFGSPLFNDDHTNVHNGFVDYSKKVKEYYSQSATSSFLDQIRKESSIALKEINQAELDVIKDLDKIRSPYFIGQGSNDEMVNPNGAKILNERLINNGINTTFKWYEGAKHVLTINNAHHQLEDDVIEFLNKNMNG
ncbi:alpha/beta hydrolase [Companilactobacillus sp. DQM5]|uniref:alpha/beta hydrolase n=1 Tax=Companilactobacillus sp. DQM5 TaxID=3463359 RepID=UPI00405869C4